MKGLIRELNILLNVTIVLIALIFIQMINTYDATLYASTSGSSAIITSGSTTDKYIALSFDDGPHPKYTVEILDLLEKHNVKATFFVLGLHAERYPDIVRRQILEGHEVGNHSYSHINMKKASPKEIEEEYIRTQQIIYNISNTWPKLFRPPYGNYNSEVVDVVTSDEASIVLWTFYQDSKDWSNPGVEIIVNTTLNKIQNGDIILFHDYVYKPESHTVEALKKIIPDLLKKGYKFVTISELIKISEESIYTDTYK